MEDSKIIELYFERNEEAITQTDKKYGSYCHTIAMNILSLYEDAEECVNDTYTRVWNTIPPQKPDIFRAFLGRIVRNLSIDRYRKEHTQKRFNKMELMLSELEDCIPSSHTVEKEAEMSDTTRCINSWLGTLDADDRILFVKRYWYGISLKSLAEEANTKPARLSQRMYSLRLKLRDFLEKEGIVI